MSPRQLALIVLPTLLLAARLSHAATQVLSWNLSTGTSDFSGVDPIFNRFDNATVTNPLIQHAQSQVGLNGTTADYDFSWLMHGFPDRINTSLTQTFRTAEVREVSENRITFSVTENAEFSVNSILNYSHTPLDWDDVGWQVSLTNLTTQQSVFNRQFIGGGGHLLPSSGTFTVNETGTLLAGNRYRIVFNLDASNQSDIGTTGTMDISGFVNFNLTPEPSSLMLAMILMGPIAARRRRRGR